MVELQDQEEAPAVQVVGLVDQVEVLVGLVDQVEVVVVQLEGVEVLLEEVAEVQ